MTLLIVAATGMVGLGAATFLNRPPRLHDTAAAKVFARTESRPVLMRPQPPAASPVPLAEAAPAPEAEPAVAPNAASSKASFAATRRSARPTTAGSAPAFSVKPAGLPEAQVDQSKPPIRLEAPGPVAQHASCEQDPDGEACRLAVIQADLHLRAVYESAFDRGVSRRVLVDYRDRWAELRVRDNDDPVRLIENYRALANELRRQTADDEGEAPRPKSRSGLRALGDLLLPWW